MSNIPRPLRNPPAAMFNNDRQQMSFGERAALEGLLCQLRPHVAVEVGSAAGGSLARIARHSRTVHSFDLAAPDNDVAALPNVHLHTGDSRFELPVWLDGTRGRHAVDFVLIDGDHTGDGVHADLRAVVDSDVCARTVIVLHDTANDQVRQGVQAALVDARSVVYHELHFVAGYTFAEGPFSGEQWGGLGLVVTGDRSTDGYGEQPAQTLYR